MMWSRVHTPMRPSRIIGHRRRGATHVMSLLRIIGSSYSSDDAKAFSMLTSEASSTSADGISLPAPRPSRRSTPWPPESPPASVAATRARVDENRRIPLGVDGDIDRGEVAGIKGCEGVVVINDENGAMWCLGDRNWRPVHQSLHVTHGIEVIGAHKSYPSIANCILPLDKPICFQRRRSSATCITHQKHQRGT